MGKFVSVLLLHKYQKGRGRLPVKENGKKVPFIQGIFVSVPLLPFRVLGVVISFIFIPQINCSVIQTLLK